MPPYPIKESFSQQIVDRVGNVNLLTKKEKEILKGIKIDGRTKKTNKFGFTANTPELIKIYKKLWAQENQEKIKIYYRNWWLKHPHYRKCIVCGKKFEVHLRTGNRAKTCSKKCSKQNRKNWLKKHAWGKTIDYRKLVLYSLGNKCAKCGFSNQAALQIDHINGDGYKESKKFGGKYGYRYYKYVWNQIKNGVFDKYQILCANCNWIKRMSKQETNQWRETNRKTYNKLLKNAKKLGEFYEATI